MKKSLFLAIGLLCLLFICPAQCVDGARSGLLLWFNTIIPTLFPFILATNLIREMNGIPYLERLFHPILSRLPGLSPGGELSGCDRPFMRLSHGCQSRMRQLYVSSDQPPGSQLPSHLLQ